MENINKPVEALRRENYCILANKIFTINEQESGAEILNRRGIAWLCTDFSIWIQRWNQSTKFDVSKLTGFLVYLADEDTHLECLCMNHDGSD